MIINVYKPRGWTSNDVVQKIKHSCGYSKVGHAGTLDPLAEGVLIILTDSDTKRQNEFMELDKEYVVKIAFGYESDSHDLGVTIKLLGKDIGDGLTLDVLGTVLKKYIGTIHQQVPSYSAVHVNGRRLYKISREASFNEIPLPYKDIDIYDINICTFFNNEQLKYPEIGIIEQINCTTAELKVSCGKGTYIRSLVRDIGKDIGCGAVAVSLIRTKVGEYNVGNCSALDDFLLKQLKP